VPPDDRLGTLIHPQVVATSLLPAHFHFGALRRCWAREMPRFFALAYPSVPSLWAQCAISDGIRKSR
jgi:hypothetical protein